MSDQKHVVIIGGGISGMATAYALQDEAQRAGLDLTYTLIERDKRLGGKIATEQTGGFTIEGGPDCFIGQKPWAADLCRRLGIGDELIGTNDERRKTFVLNHRRLTPLPDGVLLIVPTRFMPFVTSTLISWPGKIRMGMDLFLPRRKDNADESVAAFVRRRLGQEALDKIAEPLMGGIHVSDPELQSLLGTFPRFRKLEMEHRSLVLGMLAGKRKQPAAGQPAMPNRPGASASTSSNGKNGHNGAVATSATAGVASQQKAGPTSLFISLRNGLGKMVKTLHEALAGEILLGTAATTLTRTADGRYEVQTSDGRTLVANAIVLAAPAYVSGDLVRDLAPELAALLYGIRYVSTATISLGFRASEAGPLNGFGYVVPRREGRQVSACTWTSTKFNYRAPDDGILLRCFVGGPGKEELVDLTDEQLLTMARREVAEIMGLRAEPVVTRIYRWRRANPQYDVGHLDRVAQMQALCAEQPGLYITGSAYEGVGVPDCVHQGQQTAARVVRALANQTTKFTTETQSSQRVA
jgi:protoporphyrinogen/coproporphyrinogen III oxidase